MKSKLNSKKILKEIENKKPQLKKIGVKKIGLFGSFIKNKQRQNSDVDIIVKLKNKTFDSYAELYLLLEELFKRKIDLVIEDNLRPELNCIKKEVEYAEI